MLREHKKIVSTALYLADITAMVLSFFTAYWIRKNYLGQIELPFELPILRPISDYYWLVLIIIPVWSLLLFHYKAYRSFRLLKILDELKIIIKTAVLGGILAGAVIFILKFHYINRTLLMLTVLISIMLLAIERLLVRLVSRWFREKGFNSRNILIVGVDDSGARFLKTIEEHKEWGLNVIGFLTYTPERKEDTFHGYKVLGVLKDLGDIIKREVLDEVVFASPKRDLNEFEEAFLMLEDAGINARMMVDFFPHTIAKINMEELDNIPLLTFTTTPTDTFALIVKRLFDVVVSSVLLVLASPIMLTSALAIRVSSKGPALFKQTRYGLNGRTFTLYKFRSMVMDAEEKRLALEEKNEMKGPVFKIKNDPRVTRVGRVIRKTSIDELPQLLNVFKGDMSIVGPRPPIPSEVENYERRQRRRLSMKPGLTCLWQINGRNKVTDFDEWVRLDLEYIDRWSLALDMKIFFKTIPVVFFGKGAA